jgi:hypothetical protein
MLLEWSRYKAMPPAPGWGHSVNIETQHSPPHRKIRTLWGNFGLLKVALGGGGGHNKERDN